MPGLSSRNRLANWERREPFQTLVWLAGQVGVETTHLNGAVGKVRFPSGFCGLGIGPSLTHSVPFHWVWT
jgi:hypothetical protein